MGSTARNRESWAWTCRDYDWDLPAKVVSFHQVASHADLIGHTQYHRPPTHHYKIHKFVRKFRLTHGDILRFGNYRDANSYIVVYDGDSGLYSLLKNPNHNHAGYLTIPQSVCRFVKDAVRKFAAILARCEVVNIHVDNNDGFVMKHLGHDVSKDWKIDLQFENGALLDVWVKSAAVDWVRFDAEEVSPDFTRAAIDRIKADEVLLTISLKLHDGPLWKFMRRFRAEACRQCGSYCMAPWEVVRPALPTAWVAETVRSADTRAGAAWEWMCRGPRQQVPTVLTYFKELLKGIPFSYSSDRDHMITVNS